MAESKRLRGQFERNVDAKGRLALPSKLRSSLPSDLVITLSPKKDCLYLFDEDGFDAWLEEVFDAEGGFKANNSRHVAIQTVLASSGVDIHVDDANRINLGADMRRAAGIDKEVVVVGVRGYVQIWDKQRWEEFNNLADVASFFGSSQA